MMSRSSSIATWPGSSAVLAHQGGWDEGLLIAVPILVIVALLALARQRANRVAADRERQDPPH